MGDNKTQPNAQAGRTSQASGVAGEVGVPHSSVDLHYFKGCKEPRGDTYSMRGGEAKDAGMAGATRIVTPNKVRELQIALYRKAKAQPKYRFWSRYGELLRREVLERALEAQIRHGGEAGEDVKCKTCIKVQHGIESHRQMVARSQDVRWTELRSRHHLPVAL